MMLVHSESEAELGSPEFNGHYTVVLLGRRGHGHTSDDGCSLESLFERRLRSRGDIADISNET